MSDADLSSNSTLDAAAAIGLISYEEMEARALRVAMEAFTLITFNQYNSTEEEEVSRR